MADDGGLPFRLMLVIVYGAVGGAWEMFESIVFLLRISFFNPAQNVRPIAIDGLAAMFGALLIVSGILLIRRSYWARYTTMFALVGSAVFDLDPAIRGFVDAQILVALNVLGVLILLFTKGPFLTTDRTDELAEGSGTNFGVR